MSAAQALFLFTPLLLVHLISAITNQELLDRFISPNCSVNSFDCGEKCIPINRFHDCVNDCADGLDEECWPGMIKCDGCRCVDPQDADVLCLDRQGSMISKFCNTRPETKFECNNGVCVLLKWILDGRNDCGDWSDENPCNFGYDSRCPSGTLCRFILPMSMECYCPSAGWTHNGIECVPPLANTTSTTTTTTTTSTTTTAPKCPGCVPNNLTDLYATLNTSIKFAYVLDTGVRMADDVKFLSVATQTYLIPLAATFPGRIVQYVFLPFTTTVGILETSNNPVMFSQAVARVTALGFELPICDRAIFAAFSTATPAGTPPGSIVTIFTNGGASDLSRTAAVLTDAVSRQITVNVIVSDANCDCICSWRTDKNLETIAALQLLTTLTHGFFFEMAPTANAYSAGMKIVTDMTRPDSHPFLRMSGINSLSIQKPIDSGLDAAELVAWGGNVAFEALNQISSANQYRFGGNTTSGAELLGLIPMTTYAATIVADNFTIGRMQMLGWPNVLATLSPNPFSTNPILSQSPAFGLPFYVLLGHTFSDVIQWNINFVALLNTLTGDVERSGRTVAYSNPAAPGYFAIFGPFVPPCTHFDVMVSGTNIGGEPFERLAHETFLVVDQSSRLANLLPGTCATGQFDCGDQSTCIDAVKLADCVPDCPNGLDEARAKTSSLCMANSTICMPGDVTGQPTPTTPASTTPRSPCAYCAPDDVYKDVEPVSAAFTILMRDPADISKIADSIDSSIGNLINAFPNRLENIVLTPSNTNSAIVPGDVKTAVNALTANVTSNCAKSIITSAIQAVDSAENGSTLTVFIDSYASDLDLGDQLLAKAVRKGIKVNVVLLDSSCSCICTEQNRESNTTDLLEKITKITHGSFYEVPNSADAINKVAVAAINGLYPNALSLARMSATKGSVSTSVPVDSGLISMQTQAQGSNVQLTTTVQAPQTVAHYIDESTTKADQLDTVFPNTNLRMTASASGKVQAEIKATGWPAAVVALSPNPFDASPILSHDLPIGLPLYLLVGHTNFNLVQWNVSSLSLLDSMTGEELMLNSTTFKPYSNQRLAQNFSAVYGPFVAPTADYFDVSITGFNPGYEPFLRLADRPFLVANKIDDALDSTPGKCFIGKFDCGDGQCISSSKYHDCISDCANGLDEARTSASTTCTAAPPKCDSCVLHETNPLYASEPKVSMILVVDTGIRMTADLAYMAAALQSQGSLLLREFPDHIDQYVILPYDTIAGTPVLVQNMSAIQSALQSLSSSSSSSDSCQKPLFSVLTNAVNMATRGSIVTIFTDSAASDLFAQDALNSLLEKAVEKDIQINAVLTDHGCQCMCIDFDTASTVNPSSDVFQALRRLTRLTQGSLTEMDKTQKGYNAAVELVVKDLRPDSFPIAKSYANLVSALSVPVDDGLTSAAVVVAGYKSSVQIKTYFDQPIRNSLSQSSSSIAILPLIIPSTGLVVIASAAGPSGNGGPVSADIKATGWPKAIATLTHNPDDSHPIMSNSIAYGLPVFVLLDHAHSILLQLQISKVRLLDSDTGKELLSDTPRSYSNPNATYGFIIGPITPPCTYFDIEISGKNAAGNSYRRLVPQTFVVRDGQHDVLEQFPGDAGNCSYGMLHCGNGVCIDSSKIRDCVADCPDGSDEGSTMSTVCVSRSNLTADKDCTPIKCQNCVPPKNNTNLYANDTSVWAIYVVDVGARMSDDLKYFVEAIAKHLPAVESQFPGHISDFIVVPVGDSHAPGMNLPFNSSAIDQLEDGLAQQLKSGDECQKSLMQGILSGLKLAPPGSVLTVITDSSAYDSDLSADVIKLAVDRMVQIYVILSDDSCTCICTAQNVDQKTIAAFKNIVMVTHGSLYEITKTADDYNRAIAATTLSLRPDAVLIGKITNMTSASISVPLDSGMDSIIPEAVGASLQWSTMVGSNVFFGTKIFNMTSAQSIITPLIYPGYPLTVSGTANGEIIVNVRSLAWPATLATLSPNPQATQPTTTNAPAFGVPYYLLSGFSHSQQTKVTIERMDMIECASGKVLWTGMPAAYSNPSLPDYTMMIGPIDAPCRHFDIVLYGKNVGGESVARIAKHAFVVSDRTNEVVHGFPGSCPLLGQFDCGDGTCVDEAKFRDCVVDCPNTNDEARFKQQCSSQDFFVNGSKAECVPIKCPNCLPPNGTDLYGENPPVSASYVIDIGARGVVIFDALTNATHRVFPAFDQKFPLRISKYELITISRATDRDFPAVESSTAEQFASDISELETISDGSTECNRRVLSAIQQAVDSADPGGVISVFVASGDSVLTSNNSDLVNRIIDTAAVQKRLTINIALTDKDCVCICTASNNTKNDATVLALKKIAQMTRGIFVGSAFDPTVIDGIVALTARDLRPDAIALAGSSTQSGAASVTIPVDSGLNTVTALANGVGVVIDFSGDNVSPSNKIVDTSDSVAESVSALTPGPGKTITIDAFAIGPVVLSVGAVGWPSVDVIFTLDPKSANPALTTSPLYGSRFHVLAAHSNDDKTTWPIESIEIVDAETGKTIRRGDAINLEPSIPGYSVSAGPFLAPCSYFFVTVGGTNPAGEQWKRMVKATFMAQDNYSGKFSCESGSTTCLDQSKIQDCNVDCASGIDEARSKADILFCQSSQSPDATCQPTKCTQSCDPTTNTTENIYGKEPPISAVFVVDTGTRMTDDIPLISSSLQSKLPQVTSEFPGRISSYILFPIGKEPTTSTNFDGFSSALNALSLSGSDCQRPTYQTITTAISMALPNSVMILFTDSGITDAANEKQVIDAALDKNIQINVFLTDTACACICSANDKDQQSIDSLKKLAKLTKGSFVEMPPTQANYQAAAAIASNSLRPDSVILADIASSTGISQEIALDSNLKQVTAVLNSDRTVHTGEGTITTSRPSPLLPGISGSITTTTSLPFIPPGTLQVNVPSDGSTVDVHVHANGWPSAIAMLSPNPFSNQPILVTKAVFGLPLYALVDHSQADVLALVIDKVQILDAMTGAVLNEGRPSPYNHTGNYSMVFGPFPSPCSPINILISGKNKNGERYQRIVRQTFQAFDASAEIAARRPGTCSAGQFDCGAGLCILDENIGDCTADCPDFIDEARSVTAAACGKNATNDCDPAPPEPAPPTKCPGCVPNETVNLFANAAPLTPIFVVDTGSSRMQVGWSDFTSALVDKALPVAVSKFSNQDQLQFSVVPTNNPQQYTSVKSLEQLKSSLNSVQFTNGQSCDQPLMTALLSAANISGVTPTSPLTLLTDSSISDLSLTEQVIAVALRNEIPINVIVSSMTSASNCDCLCSSVNKGSDSLSALKRIAHLTKGIYLETSKGGDYVQAANLLASIMRYDSQHFSFVAFTSNAYKHDLVADSGIDRYDGIFAATQPMTVTFQIDGIYKSEMMVDTGLSKALAVVPYPGDAISMICNMPGNTQTRLVGWPIAYALLMHDLTKPADYSTSAPYGVPVYVVFRYSNEEMVRLAIDTVTITDSESGSALLSGRPSDSVITLPVTLGPFGEAQYNFTKVFGPFMPKCRYLDISISGVNVGGERLERLVQTTFLFNSMDKTPAQTWLSADCILGMFDCGGGQCIPAQMYKDCTLQCGSGADEALPNKGEPCSALSSDQMPTCKPLVPPCVSCAPDDLDTILNNRLPIMAGFVFDTDVRPAGGQSNFAAIAAALGAQISVLTKRFPNRLTNAFVVPLGEAPGTVSSFPPNNIQQTLLQLPETTSSCSKPLLAALNSSLQTATRESVITMYLTSTASDLQALDALLLSAVEKNIIINIVIGDVSCDCICSTNNKGGDTISALKKLAMVTHGSYFEVQNAAAYDGITRLTTGDLRPDSLLLSRSEGQNNITTIIPLDSGLSAATLLAQGILPRMFNADDQTVVTILDTDSSLAAALPLVVPSVQFKSSSAANGPVSTKIAGYGWPSALVTLSPNPFADKPLLTNSPINGMPLYALVSTSDASVLPIDVKKVHITDSLMGTELASGNVVSYANNGAPQYSFIYGPFSAPKSTNQQPLYFDVAIDARNVAGEDIRRVAKQAFIVRDKSTDIDDHLPGSCNSGEFDCGEGVCIDQSKYLDCVIDCADGIDEARPISSSSSLTCEPFPPKCTTGCVPTLPPTQLYANESALSAVFLLDTSLSMSAARGLTASAVQESLQKVINTFPKRIDKLILIPVAQVVLPATTFQNLTELTSRMLSTVSDSTLKCEKPLLQALINGIDSSSPSSVITLITDSSVSDLYQLNDVIDSAVSSGVQINVIVSDDDCNCVCTKDSKSPTSIDALKKLTRVTHGTFFEIAATNNAYHGAIAVTSESTRPDWVLLGDQVSNGTASISVALDRGLDTVTALSSGTNAHQNISAAAVQPVKNDVINEPNVNADQLPIVFPGSLTVNGATVGNGEVDTQIFGLGWPAALAALTSNPSAQTPAFVRQLVAGTNVYAVVGNSQSNILKLPILSIKLIDSITGQLIMEKIAKPYNNPAAPQYTYVTDNFTAPCSYFDIAIIAANAAGEIIERTAKSTFSLRDATDESLASIPGQCKVGEFDCGDKCIESYRYRDCIADCSNGLDEARTIPTVCAANSSDTWTCVPAPWPTTTPTAQPSSTTAAPGCNDCVPGEAFSDMPPVSAVVVVDLSSRMTNDFPLLADSLSTQLIAVAADWPNAIDSFIFVPIDTAMTLPTKTTDMSAFLQTLKGITTDGSTSCQKQLLTRLLTGIQAAKPKSVVTLVTSSGASDLSLLNSVLSTAVDKRIKVDIVISTSGCECICSQQGKDQPTLDVLSDIARITHGSFVEIADTAGDYAGAATVIGSDLRPDSVEIARSQSDKPTNVTVTFNSGLNTIIGLARGNSASVTSPGNTSSLFAPGGVTSGIVVPKPAPVLNASATITAQAANNVSLLIKGNGWPDVTAMLSPNPSSAQPLVTNTPIYGLPMYVLLGYSDMKKVALIFDKVQLTDSRTGAVLLDFTPVSYSNPSLPMFAAQVGPFAVPCDYFDISVVMHNSAKEKITRLSPVSYKPQDKSEEINDHLPGDCMSGQFFCTDGTCLDADFYLDCNVDCADGSDEARPISANQCTSLPTQNTTCTPGGPTPCANCVPPDVPGVYANYTPITMAYVLDTGARMTGDIPLIASATTKYLLNFVKQYITRINSFIFVPVDLVVRPTSSSMSPLNFQDLLVHASTTGSMQMCAKPLYNGLLKAIDLSGTGGVITMFTDGTATDINLENQIISNAIAKQITINIVLADSVDCYCVCSKNNTSPDFIISAERIVWMTHGDLIEVAELASDYNGAVELVTEQLAPNAVQIGRSRDKGRTKTVVPLDSGLRTVAVVGHGSGTSQELTVTHSSISGRSVLSSNTKAVIVDMPKPATSLTAMMTAKDTAMLDVRALGWPSIRVSFSPNPWSQNPIVSYTPAFGLPLYILVGHSESDKLKLPVTSVKVIDTETGNVLMNQGNASAYMHALVTGYHAVAGPVRAFCSYVDIIVTASNNGGEQVQRLSSTAFIAQDKSDAMMSQQPGPCSSQQFHCGNGICIPVSKKLDCNVDCANGLDEVRPMDSFHCWQNNSVCSVVKPEGPYTQWCSRNDIFHCANGYCIPLIWVNDGVNDCGDMSDENGTYSTVRPPTTTTPMPTTANPYPEYPTTSVPPPATIDLDQTIFNNKCPRDSKDKCPNNVGPYFQCVFDGKCIPLKYFRDGKFHCVDGSDEVCPSGMVKCLTGKCGLPSENETQCDDRQVQEACNRRTMWPCKTSDFCAPIYRLLDGVADCMDCSDEDATYLDECYLGLANCDVNSVCGNVHNGTYTCTCKFGWNGDGKTCAYPHSGPAG